MADGPEIVVIGGGYAGLTAAARLGEASLGARITMIDAKTDFVERIRLHEVAAGAVPRAYPYRPFLEARGVAFLQGWVTGLDPERRRLSVTGADRESIDVGYDWLVYALGSLTDSSAVPGIAGHALTLDTIDSAREIGARAAETARTGGRLLVVGGGLTGIEAACELAERLPRINVSLAVGERFAANSSAGGLSPDGLDHVHGTFRRLGIDTHVGSRVTRLEDGMAHFGDGSRVPFDLCIWAAGFNAPSLARDAGVTVTPQGQIETDAALRSISHPNIIAVGDAASVSAEPGGACRMSCATGRPMGEAAAVTLTSLIVDRDPPDFEFGYTFRCVSLGRANGLIQFVDQRDAPAKETWRGERGARWKEYICRRTLQGIGLVGDLGTPPDQPPDIRTRI